MEDNQQYLEISSFVRKGMPFGQGKVYLKGLTSLFLL